jgi:hypothetical protein
MDHHNPFDYPPILQFHAQDFKLSQKGTFMRPSTVALQTGKKA